MRRPDAAAVVAVKILVEQYVIAKMRIRLDFLAVVEYRSFAILVAEKDAAEPVRDLVGDVVDREKYSRAGRALDLEIVAIIMVKLLQ